MLADKRQDRTPNSHCYKRSASVFAGHVHACCIVKAGWKAALSVLQLQQAHVDSDWVQALSEASESTRGPTPSQMDILARRPMPAGHQSSAESYPLQRATQDLLHFSVMPDDHRNYALTWFALSAAVLPLGIRALRSKRVSRHGA